VFQKGQAACSTTATPSFDALILPEFIWDDALIRRCDLSGPRDLSYPTAVEFNQTYPMSDCANRWFSRII
jgi:oxygen-independent coproporphyrinogen-3 oxidase